MMYSEYDILPTSECASPRSVQSGGGCDLPDQKELTTKMMQRSSVNMSHKMSQVPTLRSSMHFAKYELPVEMKPEPVTFSDYGNMILESMPFQVFMAGAIVINAIVIGLETDMPDLKLWSVVEVTFLVVFTSELVFRLVVIGPRGFFDPEGGDFVWNCFDFSIVGMGLFDTILSHLVHNDGHGKKHGGGFSTVFRIIRLLRIMRIFRIVRFLKQLYMLVFGFGVAAIATLWVTVLAIVILYVCAIVMVHLVEGMAEGDPGYEVLSVKFNSVGMAMFTFFELMINPDLQPYKESMAEHVTVTIFLFAFVVFGSFGMLALLTGVISESMFEKNQVRLEEERGEREIKRKILSNVTSDLFEDIANGDEEVSPERCKAAIPSLIEVLMKCGFAFTAYDLDTVFTVTDSDDSGGISKSEFVHAICSCSEGVQAATVMELHQCVLLLGVKHEKRHEQCIKTLLDQHEVTHNRQTEILGMLEYLKGRVQKLEDSNPPALVSGGQQTRAREQSGSSELTELAKPLKGYDTSIFKPSISLDSRLAIKIDACEAIVREMRYVVYDIANSTQEVIRRVPAPSGECGEGEPERGEKPQQPREQAQQLDPWNEEDFQGPLEICEMWEPAPHADPAFGPRCEGVYTDPAFDAAWRSTSREPLLASVQ